MTLSLNERALALADRLAADADALQVDVTTLSNGARLIDCRAGGFEAGSVDHAVDRTVLQADAVERRR